MKRCLVILALVAIVAGTAVAGDAPWFDMENCAFCTNLSPEMMQSMTWDQANISNGIVCITTVPEKYLKDYRTAHKAMVETGERMMNGEQLEVCGSCAALGMCMMKGPHQEYAETKTGDVWILTSDNPEIVAELQAWAKRNHDEMARMMHEGGSH